MKKHRWVVRIIYDQFNSWECEECLSTVVSFDKPREFDEKNVEVSRKSSRDARTLAKYLIAMPADCEMVMVRNLMWE